MALVLIGRVEHAPHMATKNLVTAVERNARGMVLRLSVGIADLDARVWLARPAAQSAFSIARRIRAGEQFQTLHDGELGPNLGVESHDGIDLVVEIEENPPSGFQLGDLPPC